MLPPFRHPQSGLATRLAKSEAGYPTTGIIQWVRHWMVAPALWEIARRFVRGDRGTNRALSPPEHPTPLAEIIFPRPEGGPYWVPVERIVNLPGQHFTKEQHHFVRYLESGFNDFQSFYRIHQPETILQARFLNEITAGHSGARMLDEPWRHVSLNTADTPGGRSVFYGPVSDLALAIESARLDLCRQSIEKFGFLEGHDGHPGGPITSQVFIRDDGDFRVGIESGNHRTAVLAHLGWKLIPVHPQAGFHPVRLSDLEKWPGVVDGRYAPETAREIFEAFFRPRHQQLLPGW